jgi:hypothetical protein
VVVTEDRLLDLGAGLHGRLVEHADRRCRDEATARQGRGEAADARVLVCDVVRRGQQIAAPRLDHQGDATVPV